MSVMIKLDLKTIVGTQNGHQMWSQLVRRLEEDGIDIQNVIVKDKEGMCFNVDKYRDELERVKEARVAWFIDKLLKFKDEKPNASRAPLMTIMGDFTRQRQDNLIPDLTPLLEITDNFVSLIEKLGHCSDFTMHVRTMLHGIAKQMREDEFGRLIFEGDTKELKELIRLKAEDGKAEIDTDNLYLTLVELIKDQRWPNLRSTLIRLANAYFYFGYDWEKQPFPVKGHRYRYLTIREEVSEVALHATIVTLNTLNVPVKRIVKEGQRCLIIDETEVSIVNYLKRMSIRDKVKESYRTVGDIYKLEAGYDGVYALFDNDIWFGASVLLETPHTAFELSLYNQNDELLTPYVCEVFEINNVNLESALRHHLDTFLDKHQCRPLNDEQFQKVYQRLFKK